LPLNNQTQFTTRTPGEKGGGIASLSVVLLSVRFATERIWAGNEERERKSQDKSQSAEQSRSYFV